MNDAQQINMNCSCSDKQKRRLFQKRKAASLHVHLPLEHGRRRPTATAEQSLFRLWWISFHGTHAGAAAPGAGPATTVLLSTTFAPFGSISPFFPPHLQIIHDESQSKLPAGISHCLGKRKNDLKKKNVCGRLRGVNLPKGRW